MSRVNHTKEVFFSLQFGSVGVLGYSIVRDIQLQGELDNLKRMIEDLEDAGIADLDKSATSLCTTVRLVGSGVLFVPSR